MNYIFQTNEAWRRTREYLVRIWGENDQPFVLDIGCNEGLFLAGLPVSWKRHGIEASRESCLTARSNQIKIIGHFLGDDPTPWHGRFDIVCLFDVFEHLPNPQKGLAQALRFLKPGGLFFVSTGNIRGWTWQWLGPQNYYLATPLHLSFASPEFFRWFSRRFSAQLVKIIPISHRAGGTREKIEDLISVLYEGFRQKGGLFRIPQRAIQFLPRWRHLMHKTRPPFSVHLKDHILVVMRLE
ncbi:MAG: class I SAM-dependent methyltransferase [Desulfobacterales bacterium]|nr:class I SAM-dependent methyltransferase [Desulfobacterales bacterium]